MITNNQAIFYLSWSVVTACVVFLYLTYRYLSQELGLIRKPSSFMSSISDERGQELLYAGMPISQVFKDELGIGGVLGLLWFQKR